MYKGGEKMILEYLTIAGILYALTLPVATLFYILDKLIIKK